MEELDAYARDFRDQSLIAAGSPACSPTAEVRKPPVRDTTEAARKAEATEGDGLEPSHAWYTPYRAYLMLAASVALVGAFLVLAFWLHNRLEGPRLVVVLGSVAFLGALAAIAFTRRLWLNDARGLQSDDKHIADYNLAFVSDWHAVEIVLRALVSRTYGESAGQASAMEVVKLAARMDVLTGEERHSLFELLTTHDRILESRLKLGLPAYFASRRSIELILRKLHRSEAPY
jgi:hypothetical protein